MHLPTWAVVFVIVVLGVSLRVLFAWTPSSKRGTIIGVVLSLLLGLLAILIGSGLIKL